MTQEKLNNRAPLEEKEITKANGMGALAIILALFAVDIAIFVYSVIMFSNEIFTALSITAFVVGVTYLSIVGWIPLMGLKVIKPNEALVLTLFGHYYGTIKREGFYFVNPFASAVNPTPLSHPALPKCKQLLLPARSFPP